jgi:metal transporter CNNM
LEVDFLDPATLLILKWVGVVFCISQSAMFSGLNLAFFSVSRLRLEVEVGTGNKAAARILRMREDSNFLLTTILWGNVGINVLLTLLLNSVMAGLSAFLFSTIIITLFGEIFPQAYFSRNALKIGAALAPVLRVYQYLLFAVAKPVALLLDLWLGKEGVDYLRERDMREVIRQHMVADESDLDRIEGVGALNFLALDDQPASHEGEPLDPQSIISMPFKNGQPKFPLDNDSGFLRELQSSGKKWVILTDMQDEPQLVIDTDGYLRSAILDPDNFNPKQYCHRPVIIRDSEIRLGHILQKLEVDPSYFGDNVIDRDVVLVWTDERRVITGADILGRLLSGISRTQKLATVPK